MTLFEKAHVALFEELEQQRIYAADVVKLTAAVLKALELTARTNQERVPYQRCANGACE